MHNKAWPVMGLYPKNKTGPPKDGNGIDVGQRDSELGEKIYSKINKFTFPILLSQNPWLLILLMIDEVGDPDELHLGGWHHPPVLPPLLRSHHPTAPARARWGLEFGMFTTMPSSSFIRSWTNFL